MSWLPWCFDLLVGTEPPVVDVSEVTSWRERAERAEARAEAAEQRLAVAALNAFDIAFEGRLSAVRS